MPLPTAPPNLAPAETAAFADDTVSSFVDHEARIDTLEAAAGSSSGLDDLTDVDTSTTPPTDGQALVYDDGTSLWVPGTVATGGGTITVEDEGVSTVAAATTLDFVGAGVTVTDTGSGQATVTIPGGGADAVELLELVTYRPVSDTNLDASGTSLADVDATNLAVTFTAPSSGQVMVRLEAAAYNNTDNAIYSWGLREGTSIVSSTNGEWVHGINGQTRARATFVISGLTPSTSYTYKWAHRRDSGNTARIRVGPVQGAAVMEVWGIPLV